MALGGTDLNLLRVLDALLREGSTVRAGARLGLSQPAVSAALGRLRHTLGDPLFVRRGRGLEPTEFARRLAPEVTRLVENIEAVLHGRARFDPATENRVFRLAGSDFFAPTLLPRLEARLAREAPGIVVQLVDLPQPVPADALEPGAADLLLGRAIAPAESILQRDLIQVELVVCARAGHPALATAGLRRGQVVPLDLYCALRHVVYAPDAALTHLADPVLARLGRRRVIAQTVADFSSAFSVVARSDLVSLLPAQLALSFDDGRILTYAPPFDIPPVRAQMAWALRTEHSLAHRWLREMVADIMTALPSIPPGVAAGP